MVRNEAELTTLVISNVDDVLAEMYRYLHFCPLFHSPIIAAAHWNPEKKWFFW